MQVVFRTNRQTVPLAGEHFTSKEGNFGLDCWGGGTGLILKPRGAKMLSASLD